MGFTPAISPRSAKRIRHEVRGWRLHLRVSRSLGELAQGVNPIIRGWINYYSAYQHSSLGPVLRHIDRYLLRWVKRKYKKKGRSMRRARRWLGRVVKYQPELFVHWRLGASFAAE